MSTWTSGTGMFDVRLSGLTASQSQRVRDLARQALAERGIETVVHAGHLAAADGRQFGLNTLASLCHTSGLGQNAWPGIVTRYLDDLLSTWTEVPPAVTAEQMRAEAYLRLVKLDAMPPDMREVYGYARRLGGGFVELLVHRDGDHVRFLTDDDVAKVGADELRAIGRANLLAVRPDECELVRRDRACFHTVRGESGFIASKLLVLPELIRIVLGRKVAYPDGVVVAMPNRHELAFAPVDADVVDTLIALAPWAVLGYDHGHAPLSPFVYWWRDGELTQLTDADRTGAIEFLLVEDLGTLLRRHNPGADAA